MIPTGKTELFGEKNYIISAVDEKLACSNNWMLLTGENWIIGWETLHNVGGRWKLVCSNGWVFLKGENWIFGWETLLHVGGRRKISM